MVETLQSSFEVSCHIRMNLVILLVPFYGDANINFPLPVVCDCVILLEGKNKVFSMLFPNVFHSKIVA